MQKRKLLTVERLEQIATNAILGGYGVVETFRDTGNVRRKVTLLCAMDCQSPYIAELHARDSAWHGKAVKPLIIELHSRCRRCEPCRSRKVKFWQARAVAEYEQASLTLFGTLTFAPERDVEVDCLARVQLAEKGVDFDQLPPDEKFRQRTIYAGVEITRWLKRVREGDTRRGKPDFRYLLIAEAHDSARTSDAKRGRPHWHCLIHEKASASALVLSEEWAKDPTTGDLRTDRYGNPFLTETAFLKRQWTQGHSTFAMCRSPQAAGYLCKYIAKEDTRSRVRASFRYGAAEAAPHNPPGPEGGPQT